jgi:ubiquinone/menaquinone biosynthesis C-methylase UbiE
MAEPLYVLPSGRLMAAKTDSWSEWLAHRRFGGDADVERAGMEKLARLRDQVLDRSGLEAGESLLDVGCGEGLIGFGALERGAGSVIFSDISHRLLSVCREAAESLAVLERSRFVAAAADDLSAVDSESVDVVTTRSVLIYVANKQAAFAELFRVLRPGGRISLYEPINSFARSDGDTWCGYDVTPVVDVFDKVRGVYEAIQPVDSDPMLDFDERELIRLAEAAGFFPVDLLFHAEVTRVEPRPWQTFLDVAGNPKIPTLAEAMERVLSYEERERLTAHLRPLVEGGHGVWRMGHALLSATRPPA